MAAGKPDLERPALLMSSSDGVFPVILAPIPAAYRRFSGLVETGGLFLLAGLVDEEDGTFSIRVCRVVRLQGSAA